MMPAARGVEVSHLLSAQKEIIRQLLSFSFPFLDIILTSILGSRVALPIS